MTWFQAMSNYKIQFIAMGEEYSRYLVMGATIITLFVAILIKKLIFCRKNQYDEDTILKYCLDKFNPEPLIPLTGSNTDKMVVDDPGAVNLGNLDFLSLLQSQKLKNVAQNSIKKFGVGTCGPRDFFGTNSAHRDLEKRLTDFYGTEMSLIYSFGAVTTKSVIMNYIFKDDIVFVDEYASKQIQLGLKGKRVKGITFKHNRPHSLLKILEQMEKGSVVERKFLILEGISENTGQICLLKEFLQIARKFKIRVIVDESYSFGILGENGRGITEYCNVPVDEIDAFSGNFETSISNIGGFSTGPRYVIEVQQMVSVSYVYSASLSVFHVESVSATLDMIQNRPQILKKLAREIHSGLERFNRWFNIISDEDSPRKIMRIEGVKNVRELKSAYSKIVSFLLNEFSVFTILTEFGICLNLYYDLYFDDIKKERLYSAFEAAIHVLEEEFINKSID